MKYYALNVVIYALLGLAVACGNKISLAGAVAPDPENPGALLPAIMRAYHSGRGQIVIPPGVYKLPEPRGGFYLSFNNMKDFRIIGKGVTLLRTDPTKGGIQFTHCRNVTLDGITLRCDPIPYTQGRIIALRNTGIPIRLVRICRGYRTNMASFTNITVFSARRRWIWPGMTPFHVHDIKRLGVRTFRIMQCSVPCKVGDWMVFRSDGRSDIQVNSCWDMHIGHVSIIGGTGYCFGETGGRGDNWYIDDSIIYPPKPQGARTSPILGSCADGFHSNSVRHGPNIIGCHFEGTGDDAIAIQGWYAVLRHAIRRNWVVEFPQSLGSDFCKAGDLIRIDTSHGSYLGSTYVVSKKLLNGYRPKQATSPQGTVGMAFNNSKFYAVTVRNVISQLTYGDRINDTNVDGAGFVIRNCVIKQGFSRGMILKADNGIIIDNIIDTCANGDIELLPELSWDESGSSSNILIEGNTISDTSPIYSDPAGWNEAGAVSILSNMGAARTSCNHANIVITDNRFVANNGINLLVSGVRNMLFSGNRFIKPMYRPDNRGADYHFGTSDLIWLQQCKNILLAGNRVIHPGPALKKLVGVGPDVSNVMGIKNGVKIAAAASALEHK